MRLVTSVVDEGAHSETCMMCFVGKSFGDEINCLVEMHVCNADCVKSFEKVVSVLTNAC